MVTRATKCERDSQKDSQTRKIVFDVGFQRDFNTRLNKRVIKIHRNIVTFCATWYEDRCQFHV